MDVEQSRLEHSRLHVARGLVNARFKNCSILCAACWLLAAVEHIGLEHLRVLTLLALKPTLLLGEAVRTLPSFVFVIRLDLALHGHAPAQKVVDVGDMDDDGFDYDPSDMGRPLGVGEAIASWTNLFNPGHV